MSHSKSSPNRLGMRCACHRILARRSMYVYRSAGQRCWISLEVAKRMGLNPNRSELRRIIDALDDHPRIEKTFKDDSRSLVRLVRCGGHAFVIKQYRVEPWKTWCHHLVRRTPAWREWRYAGVLACAGRRVSLPLALVHRYRFGGWWQTLTYPYVKGLSLQLWLGINSSLDPSDPRKVAMRLRMAEAIGRQLGLIIAAGLINRDHKTGNLIVDSACEQEGEEPVIIDPARVKRRWSDRQVYRMLELLWWTTWRSGDSTQRERLACLRAVVKADPSLASKRRHRLRATMHQVNCLFEAHMARFNQRHRRLKRSAS